MTIALHDVVAQKKGIYDRQKKVHCGQKKSHARKVSTASRKISSQSTTSQMSSFSNKMDFNFSDNVDLQYLSGGRGHPAPTFHGVQDWRG